jgi:large subunit ribosomal protein L2
MPSGEIRLVPSACCATIGQVGNVDHGNIVIGNAAETDTAVKDLPSAAVP